MNPKLVKYYPCDECGTRLHKHIDYGYEENQSLCQECYNKAIEAYEGELIETESYKQAYEILLERYSKLQIKSAAKIKKLKAKLEAQV
jgi:hypothetical protein